MLFRRFYDDNLAQASYMLGCEKTREAIIVDPNADVAYYTRAAGADRLRITHVTETHIHADFVSGAAALADSTGARLHLSAEGGGEWGYRDAVLGASDRLRDGSEITIGQIRLRALHTPGHTPEHLTFLVFDLARGPDPVGTLTGDFVFVGDVGRPDLLETAAGVTGTMEGSARQLYQSVRRFGTLPDYLQIWPGHGAGSACGKSLGAMPQTTLGYEKLFNWAFADLSERDFVARVLENQPVPPRYFAEMKDVNRGGHESPKSGTPRILGLEELQSALKSGATIIDTRPAQKFAGGHVPGTVNIPFSKSFLNWSGALVPAGRDFYLLTDREGDEAVKELLGQLCKIGLTAVRGVFPTDLLREWKSRFGDLARVDQVDSERLRDLTSRDRVQVVDVRNPDEWASGHLPGALHIPLAALPERLGELDPSAAIVVHCQGGGRSSIAASYLQSRGISNVSNLSGGYEDWASRGFEVTAEKPVSASSGESEQ